MEYLTWYHYGVLLGMFLSLPAFFIKNHAYRKPHLIIFWVLVMIAVWEIVGLNIARRGINNSVYANLIFVYTETLLLLYFFSLIFQERKIKEIILISGLLFVAWGFINSFFIESILFFQTYSFAMGSLVLIGWCIYFFYGILYKDWYAEKNLLGVPMFWIVSMILFFYSCSFLYFSSMRMIFEMDRELMLQIRNLNRIISVSMYLVMGLAFYAPLIFKEKQESLPR